MVRANNLQIVAPDSLDDDDIDQGDGADRRRDPRRRVLKGATVAYNNRHCTMQCTIRDMSASGARLHATGSLDIPDTFELIIEVDGIEVECEVVWRYGNDVGVRFVSSLNRSTHKRDQVVDPRVPERARLLRKTLDNRALDPIGRSDRQPISSEPSEPDSGESVGDQADDVPAASEVERERSSSIEFSNNLLALLITLHSEVSRASGLIAVCGCISNAVASGTQPVEMRNLIKYFPRESASLVLASQRINRWYEPTELNFAIRDFSTKLASAKAQTIRTMENGLVWGLPAQSELIDLATHWKDACEASRHLLLKLGEQFAVCGIEGATSELSLMIRLLERVADDHYPLISPDGEVLIPDWFELRDEQRARVRCPADLIANGDRHRVLVRDMTSVGFGIECRNPPAVDTDVQIRIGEFVELVGTVIWSRDGRAGVQLIQPIYGLDPRMMFCAPNNSDSHLSDHRPTCG